LGDEKRKGNPVVDDAIDVVFTQAELDAKIVSVKSGRSRRRVDHPLLVYDALQIATINHLQQSGWS